MDILKEFLVNSPLAARIVAYVIGIIVWTWFIFFYPNIKQHAAQIEKPSGDIHQTAIGKNNLQLATTGNNSPIIIDIHNSPSHSIQATTLCYRKLENNFFITKVELYSKHTIPNVYFAAYANTIAAFNVSPQRVGISMTGHSGKREGFWFINIPNFGGKYLLVVKTKEPEEIKIEYDIE